MAIQAGGIPVLILKEGTKRTVGREAQRNNIMAARAIAEAVRTSLGPRGMDKMLVDSLGDVTVTNDGATILKEIDVQHPAAKMMVEVAKTQDDEVGDGTTTAVVLAGELLKKAEDLIDMNVHPTIIISGYKRAAKKVLKILDEIGQEIDRDDTEMLETIAKTAMASKVVAGAMDHLAKIAVEAVKTITRKENGKFVADIDDIQIQKKEGESLRETRLIKGIVIDKEVVHPGMPKTVKNAKIALIDRSLEIEKTEFDAEIRITSPEEMKAFLDQEEQLIKEMVDKIVKAGANVVFCQKGIDDVAQHFMAKAGILAVRRVKKSDMEKLAKSTGGRIVTSVDDLTEKELGYAEVVEERKVGEDKMVFVEGCKEPKAISILIRGGTELIVDEAERALHDALCVVRNAIEDNRIVPGGGACEIEIAQRLKEFAETLSGREQLAVQKFAEAIEIIPTTLAENAGHDPIDILVKLRSAHEKGEKWVGIDVFTGNVVDMMKEKVIEPLSVKRQAIKSASEAATMILKIDDIIAAAPMKEKTPPSGGEGEEETGGAGEEF